jgi:hypothetical protein
MQESLQHYLSGKKTYEYRGKPYYKVKNYQHHFYVAKEIIESLTSAPKEITLEQNHQIKTHPKGLAKWDAGRKRVMISESKIRVYFQPYEVV